MSNAPDGSFLFEHSHQAIDSSGGTMFYQTSEFPGLSPLVENHETIVREMLALPPTAFVDWPEAIYQGTWRVFPFYRFGEKVDACCRLCPRTTALIEQVEGMVTAGFSKLAPGVEIHPHRGYTGNVLRFHLGLIGGDQCGLKVGGETRTWHPGSNFVFDDTVQHSAWNRGGADRVILLMDILRPGADRVECPPHLRHLAFN